MNHQRQVLWLFLATVTLLSSLQCIVAFTPSALFSSSPSTTSNLFAATKAGYEPKWKKKSTLAEDQGSIKDLGFEKVGLKGTIPVVFNQGNETRSSMAFEGQPLRDVASQAGQYIKYGCGKGECGTCECMVNGKWIRPCIATVPALSTGEEFTVMLKATKATTVSSGTFFSVRSFLMGFWNNILGMFGFVRMRGAAKENWEERRVYEDKIAQRTKEIRELRRAKYATATP
jgi:ferredoxin